MTQVDVATAVIKTVNDHQKEVTSKINVDYIASEPLKYAKVKIGGKWRIIGLPVLPDTLDHSECPF
jgi:hypothetical protein